MTLQEIRRDVLCHGMTQVFRGATEEDAVRIREQVRPAHLDTYPYIFPLPGWVGVEQQYNLRDFAMCEALHFMGAYWGPEYCIPLSDIMSQL